MGDNLSLTTLIFLETACFAAYFLKGFSGFGPALIFIPVVALLFNPHLALSASALADLVVGAGMLLTFRYRREEIILIGKTSLGMAVGIFLGGYLTGILSGETIIIFIGVIVLAIGLGLLIFRQMVPEGIEMKNPRLLYAGAVAGGITGSVTGITGPFIIMATRRYMDKGTFRRFLVGVFLVGGFLRLVVYASVGIWTSDVLRLILVSSPGIILGLLAGYLFHRSINELWFNRLIGLVLVALAARLLLGQL